jgi:hypothetical protein
LYTYHSSGISDNIPNTVFTRSNTSVSDYAFISEPCKKGQMGVEEESEKTQLIEIFEKLQTTGYNLEIQPGSQNTFEINSELFREVQKDISFIWTGNGKFTWKLDEADYLYYKLSAPGNTVFIDYTLYPRDRVSNYFMYDSLWPFKLGKASLFESYHNEIVSEIYANTDKTILKYRADNLFDKIRLRTASDFFWNPDKYDPDLSLYRALISTFGVRLSKELLFFNDHYFKAQSELILSKSPKNYQKHIRRADTHIKELKNIHDLFLSQDQIYSSKELIDLLAGLIAEVELIREKLDDTSPDFE